MAQTHQTWHDLRAEGVTTPASYETATLKTVVASAGPSGIGVLSAAQFFYCSCIPPPIGVLSARAGYHLSSADLHAGLITSYLQADDFADSGYIVLKFWHPFKEGWIYVKSRGYIYGCMAANIQRMELSIGFTECENATSIYIHKARGTIVSTFVDDPAIWSKTKDDEAWFHGLTKGLM